MSRNAQYMKLKYFDNICEGLHRTHTKIVHQGLVGFDEGCQRVKAFVLLKCKCFLNALNLKHIKGMVAETAFSKKIFVLCY